LAAVRNGNSAGNGSGSGSRIVAAMAWPFMLLETVTMAYNKLVNSSFSLEHISTRGGTHFHQLVIPVTFAVP